MVNRQAAGRFTIIKPGGTAVMGKSSGLFLAIVRFVDANGDPLAGPAWSVEALDADPLADDDLGTATLDENGEGRIILTVADIASLDSPGERKPDLYFVLRQHGREVYQSPVQFDVDFERLDPVTGDPDQLTRDFGTIQVNL
jgi:hypothetical protein